jgi:site-specific DNA-methyltransferase (adenine-specific)
MSGYLRKEVIGDCTLYQGDMRDVLPALPEKADLCATDAPYKLTSGGKANQSMSGKFARDCTTSPELGSNIRKGGRLS